MRVAHSWASVPWHHSGASPVALCPVPETHSLCRDVQGLVLTTFPVSTGGTQWAQRVWAPPHQALVFVPRSRLLLTLRKLSWLGEPHRLLSQSKIWVCPRFCLLASLRLHAFLCEEGILFPIPSRLVPELPGQDTPAQRVALSSWPGRHSSCHNGAPVLSRSVPESRS